MPPAIDKINGEGGAEFVTLMDTWHDAIESCALDNDVVHSVGVQGDANLLKGGVLLVEGSGISMTVDSVNKKITIAKATVSAQARQIALFPQYPGVVWDESAGTLTPVAGGAGARNYYEWEAPTSTQVEATASLQVVIPQDFDAWHTSQAVVIDIWTTDGSNSAEVDVETYRNTTAGGTAVDQFSSAAWGTITFTASALAGGTWSAGDILSLDIALRATDTVKARIGKVVLNYTTPAS